ncbi:hypothetical protein FHS29_003076 [Saccharothrix tamanrassetensis]|uniref:Uncharacterized protein n=1 Tax=Saccharothrix tamanrassetensis TaxID=1051531 RepID=A0A841CHN2_9PSEU|nr:hypothetical protein [Saccharothrix tamanrassetensis]MBB5956490.1 hypothetical protein [Saccharothrix tamanrassetensis]
MNQERIIKLDEPKRDWVLRCEGTANKVFELGVSLGTVEVHLPLGVDCIRLELQQIVDFRSALDEAIERAEADLQAGCGPR